MRPTTPIPNGCSFTFVSCRVNSPSAQRFLSPNRSAPQMYRSPDSKKISLKQARSPPAGHYQFYNTFESSITESDSYLKDNGVNSRFSEVICVNNSSQLDLVLKQKNMQGITSPIYKFDHHIGKVYEGIERGRSPMGNKFTNMERFEVMEASNENNTNCLANENKSKHLCRNKEMEGRKTESTRLCPVSPRGSRINLARRVITEENKENKTTNISAYQPTLIYKSELFASPGKQTPKKYLSPPQESEIQMLKELGHSDLALRETYPSMGEMNSFYMEKSPREIIQINYFNEEKHKMISPSKYSKIISPCLANFSKKIDISVVDKADSSHYEVEETENEYEKDNRFGKMFGLTTLKSLPLKEDV